MDIRALMEMVRNVAGEVSKASAVEVAKALAGGNFGSVMSHVRSALSLPPEVLGVDILTFEASVSAGGVVTQPGNARVPEKYWFELQQILGYIEVPATVPADFVLLTFNVKQQGKRNVFSTDMSMAALLNTSGTMQPIKFDRGMHLFPPGSDIDLDFSRSGTWGGTAKKVGVCLVGNLLSDALRK